MAQTMTARTTSASSSTLESLIKPEFCWDNLSALDKGVCASLNCVSGLQFSSPLGTNYAWPVLGKAANFWDSVLSLRIRTLYDLERKYILRDQFWDGGTLCFMVGRSREASRPTVIIMCNEKAIARRFAKVISRDEKFRASRFDLRVWRTILEFNADKGQSTSPHGGSKATTVTSVRNVLGLAIRAEIPSGADVESRVATLGGVININGSTFGLTVAHLFSNDKECSAKPQLDPMMHSIGDFYDPLEESSDDGSSDDEFCHSKDGLASRESLPSDDFDHANHSTSGLPTEPIEILLPETGDLFGGFSSVEGCHACRDRDWAILALADDAYQNRSPFTGDFAVDRFVRLKGIARRQRPGTFVNSFLSVVQSGTLVDAATYFSLPGSRSLVRAYMVKTAGPCWPGECGSWFIDPKRRSAFGVVVANVFNAPFKLVIPLEDIFQDISEACGGANVELPELVLEKWEAHIPWDRYDRVASERRMVSSEASTAPALFSESLKDPPLPQRVLAPPPQGISAPIQRPEMSSWLSAFERKPIATKSSLKAASSRDAHSGRLSQWQEPDSPSDEASERNDGLQGWL